uniref:MSP domain-containing protein n=1 Tax=Cannabis sativa TaxID=3483 RepID=A0A803NVE5_CANSA
MKESYFQIGIDANNCMFPIAYVVVDSRIKKWEWFVEILKEDLQMNNSLSFTFISDRQKGLLEAVKKHAEDAEHRFCVRHMYNNFKTKHPSLTLKEMVWAAARTTTIPRFQQHMATLGALDALALAWFSDKPTSWSRSHFQLVPKCDILLNNLYKWPESWPNPRTHPLQPPLVKKRPGRPKKARNREAGEVPASNKYYYLIRSPVNRFSSPETTPTPSPQRSLADRFIMSTGELLSIEPQELQFPFELRKQISCSLQLLNKTDNYVAFKVKTTNPKKYCVRPNTGVVMPRSTCDVIVTMQAQKEMPLDMQCKDKFLLQSVVASPGASAKDVTPEMASRGSVERHGRVETHDVSSSEARAIITKLTEEKNSVLQQNSKLQQELELLKQNTSRNRGGLSLVYVIIIGLLGILLGYLFKRT